MGNKTCIAGLISFIFLISPAYGQEKGLNVLVRNLDPNLVVGKQWIVFIAINKYKKWPNLQYPTKDANSIKDILVQRYYFDEHILLYDVRLPKVTRS